MLPFKKLNLSNYCTIFDGIVPRNTVYVSAMITLIIQLVMEFYLSYKHVKLLHIVWSIFFR
jgi:hypothetical protein